MKKIISIFISTLLCCLIFTSCSEKQPEGESSGYSGILTKVRLGMDMNKIISIQQDGVDLYYETDTEIWSINNDTEIIEIRNLIPEDEAYYYADDSIITYYFNHDSKDDNYYLNGYQQELTCVLDRETAEKYFNEKAEQLSVKYGAEATGQITGTENIDEDLTYVKHITCNTFTVDLTMVLTYETVNNVDDYYATFFSIRIDEAKEKVPTEMK